MDRANKGNTVGSHPALSGIDPVTTESKDEIASPARYSGKSTSAIIRRPQAECKFPALFFWLR
jgi:hypothetical protein